MEVAGAHAAKQQLLANPAKQSDVFKHRGAQHRKLWVALVTGVAVLTTLAGWVSSRPCKFEGWCLQAPRSGCN